MPEPTGERRGSNGSKDGTREDCVEAGRSSGATLERGVATRVAWESPALLARSESLPPLGVL